MNYDTALAFEKANYKLLCDKVEQLIDAEIKYRQSRDQRLLKPLWDLEREVRLIINPKKASQATIEWQER